jgi:hypothetical protein
MNTLFSTVHFLIRVAILLSEIHNTFLLVRLYIYRANSHCNLPILPIRFRMYIWQIRRQIHISVIMNHSRYINIRWRHWFILRYLRIRRRHVVLLILDKI